MATFDITLLGKKYPELNPTTSIESGDIIALYRTGQPELNRITWLQVQKSISLINVNDFIGMSFSNGQFPKWSSSLSKFIPGSISPEDIPDLPASKITSGTFSTARIPDLPISKITGLQSELDSKEPSFSKGSIVSSTLTLSNNLNRLVGSANLGIEIDTSIFSNLFIPANRNLNFISSNSSVLINGFNSYSHPLNNETLNVDLTVNITPYVHPTGFTNQPLAALSGSQVISQIVVTNEGHVEGIMTRGLVKADVGLDQVDNTSDLNKPVSTATQAAIDGLNNRFLRKDVSDNNGINTLTLGNLTVNSNVNFQAISDEISPDYGLAIMINGTVRRTTIITPADLSNLQGQIDGLQLQINQIVQDKHYPHIQSVASNVWGPINHGLGKRPSIDVYDQAGNKITGYEVNFIDLNTVTLTFSASPSAAVAGRADFN